MNGKETKKKTMTVVNTENRRHSCSERTDSSMRAATDHVNHQKFSIPTESGSLQARGA